MPLWRRSDALTIRELLHGDRIELSTSWQGELLCAVDDRFDDAFDALSRQLPPDVVPYACGTCRLGIVDPFGYSTGRDDISCFRDAKPLADEFEQRGRHASAAAIGHLYKRVVNAFDACPDFEPRKRG